MTGLATRNSDGKRVLVACRHTLLHGFANASNGTEAMYQLDHSKEEDKIGTILKVAPLSTTAVNTVDAASCILLEGVEASYEPHLHNHGYPPRIIPGTKAPEQRMELTVLGAITGAKRVEVVRLEPQPITINDKPDRSGNNARFSGVIELGNVDLDTNRTFQFSPGDSGAPCLYKVGESSYQMCAILFGGDPNSTPPKTYALPARAAEMALDITFGDPYGGVRMGKSWIIDDYFRAGEPLHCGDVAVMRERPPSPNVQGESPVPRVYKAGADNKGRIIGIVHTPSGKAVGDRIATRSTAHSQDEFVPIVVKGVAKTLTTGMVGLGDPVMASGARARPKGKAAGVAAVEAVNNAPTAKAVASPSTAVQDAAVTLSGSGSSDPDAGDALTYSWKQTAGTTVDLSDPAAVRPTFPAPPAPATLTFELTVTDKHGATDSDTVTVTVTSPPAS